MTKIKRSALFIILLAMFAVGTLQAQTSSSPGAMTSPRGTNTTKPAHKEPCWQVAGISQSAIQQHHQIEENIHSQIEGVCSDSALTPQQKQQKIHQIHAQGQQQLNGVTTPAQQAALKSCREQRGEGHGVGMHGGGGPCGEMTPGTKQ